MNVIINLIVGLAFSFWVSYLCGYIIYKLDNNKKSKEVLSNLLLFGVLSTISAFLLSSLSTIIFPSDKVITFTSFMSTLCCAFSEEISKWIFIFISTKKLVIQKKFDAIVYSAFIALGFIFFEDVFYILQSKTFNDLVSVGLLRTVTGPIGHLFYGLIMAFYLLKYLEYKNTDKKLATSNLLFSIFVPTIIHTSYNFLSILTAMAKVPFNLIGLIIYIVLIVIFYIFLIKIILDSYKDNRLLNYNTNAYYKLPVKTFKKCIIIISVMTAIISLMSLTAAFS